MASMLILWWESVNQATKVAFSAEMDVSWVGRVGARIWKSDMTMLCKKMLVEVVVFRILVGSLDVSI